VAAHRVDLGHHRDADPGVGLGDGNGGAQAGTPTADQDHVVGGYHLDSAVELIDEDASIVADDFHGDGAVVVLVPANLAAAGVECFVSDQALLVLFPVLKALPIDDLPTGRLLVREASARGRHRIASFSTYTPSSVIPALARWQTERNGESRDEQAGVATVGPTLGPKRVPTLRSWEANSYGGLTFAEAQPPFFRELGG